MRLDLHVHTALSACAENIMSPRAILRRAAAAGVKMLAITDHNASLHVPLAMQIGAELGMQVVPGIEVSTREEVHVLALFDDPAALFDLQDLVDAALPGEQNLPEIFGYQVIFDQNDEPIDMDNRLRQVGTALSLERLVVEVHQRGGLVVPAHVFRGRFSLLSQLGQVDGNGFDLLEIAWKQWVQEHCRPGRRWADVPLITGSDAHFLEDIGRAALELPGTVERLRELPTAMWRLGEEV